MQAIIVTNGTAEEIAALALAVQGRQDQKEDGASGKCCRCYAHVMECGGQIRGSIDSDGNFTPLHSVG